MINGLLFIYLTNNLAVTYTIIQVNNVIVISALSAELRDLDWKVSKNWNGNKVLKQAK